MTNVWLFDREHRRINSGSSAHDDDGVRRDHCLDFLHFSQSTRKNKIYDMFVTSKYISFDFCCQNIDIGTISIFQ